MADTSSHPPMRVSRPAGACGQHHDNLYELQQSSCLTDFTLKVQGKAILCHKLVLASVSPYFRGMMRSKMKETQIAETNLDNYSPTVVETIIQYMYTFTIAVKYEDVKGVIEAADFLQLPDLKKHCENYVINELNACNAIGWYKVGSVFGLDTLVEHVEELVLKDFTKIVESDEFKNLTITELLGVVTRIDDEGRNYDSMLHACLSWIKYDVTDRREHLMNIISKLSIEKCSLDGLTYMIDTNRDVISHESELHMIHIFHLKLKQNKAKTTDAKNIVLHAGCELTSSSMWTCCSSDFSWKALEQTSAPDITKGGNICLVPDGLFMTGGTEGEGLSNNAHMFNAKYNIWLQLPNMHNGRVAHAAESVGNFVYVYGGIDAQQSVLNVVEGFNLVNNKWIYVNSMLHQTGILPISAKHKMSIFVINNINSGIDAMGVHESTRRVLPDEQHFQIYSTLEDTWTCGAPLPDSVSRNTNGATAICYKDALYLVGGCHKLCCRYSIDTNTWSMLSQPTLKQNLGTPLLMNQSILLLGGVIGNNAQDLTDIITEYNIEEDSWKVLDTKCPVPFKLGVAYITD